MRSFRRRLPIAMAVGLSLSTSCMALAGDWPQILGPERNGVAVGESLDPAGKVSWDSRKGGQIGVAKPVWSKDVGAGYAGPVIADGTIYLLHRKAANNVLDAVDLASGKRLYGLDFRAAYQGGIDPDDGPRATPVVVADPNDPKRKLVVCFTAEGDLHVVRTPVAGEPRGEILWSRELADDYQAPEGYFGAGSSPIVADDRILINLGGRNGAGIVAVSLSDGKTLWKATDEQASYSSPVATVFDGKPTIGFVTRYSLIGVDPADGAVRFQTAFGARGPTVSAATPLLVRSRIFVTASYGVGARLVDPAGAEPRDVWSSDEVLSSQYVTPILYDGYLYGCHGREDQGTTDLVCVHAADGKEMWRTAAEGVTHLIRVGDSALALNVDGTLTQFPLDPAAWRPVAKAKLLPASCRALPALSNGILVARNTDDDGGELVALRVGPAKR